MGENCGNKTNLSSDPDRSKTQPTATTGIIDARGGTITCNLDNAGFRI